MICITLEKENNLEAIYTLYSSCPGQAKESALLTKLRHTPYLAENLCFIATEEDALIGHLSFTRLAIKNGNRVNPGLLLTTLVAKEGEHTLYTYDALIEKGLKTARYLGYSTVLTYGHTTLYAEKGFYPLVNDNLTLPSYLKKEAFLVKHLKPELPSKQGAIHLPPELVTFFKEEVLS